VVRRWAGVTVVGVLTGAHDRATLEEAGATHVLADVTAVRGILSSSVNPEWV
jgi:phosphoglycolate phosphatase